MPAILRPRRGLRRSRLASMLLGLACTAPPHAAALDAPDLAQAPQRHPASAAPGRASASPARPTRDEVLVAFHARYLPTASVQAQWNGDLGTCEAGTHALAFQIATLERINVYRWLAGLPPVATFTDQRQAQAQAAALLSSANHDANHGPVPGSACWSAEAATGAVASNLSLGYPGVQAIDAYMDDAGASNAAVGHRRWLLYPPQTHVAIGYVSGDAMHFPAQATWVLGPFGDYPPIQPGIAWPPAGHVPAPLLPLVSRRWSYSYPAADFSQATVQMWRDGEPLPSPTLEPRIAGYGEPTLVWRPVATPLPAPGRDVVFRVRIEDVRGVGIPTTFEYEVIVVDPWTPPAPAERLFASGFELSEQ